MFYIWTGVNPNDLKPRILITGANGFIGSHVVELAANNGWEVFAGVRRSCDMSNLDGLQYTRFDFEIGENAVDVRSRLQKANEGYGGFQYIVHCAGITKPVDHGDFQKGNADFTGEFAHICLETQTSLQKFVFVSSIAALGPRDGNDWAPITESSRPEPITEYGVSKWRAEQLLSAIEALEYVIIRPSAVYGPRDHKFLLYIVRLFKHGLDFRLGPANQKMSFVHVSDLAQAILKACEAPVSRVAINVSDGRVYEQEALNLAIMDSLGVRCLKLRVPSAILRSAGWLNYKVMSLFGKQVHLTHLKMKEATAKNWAMDITRARRVLGYTPKYNLQTGIHETLRQYEKKRVRKFKAQSTVNSRTLML